jgi:hypothetical protein
MAKRMNMGKTEAKARAAGHALQPAGEDQQFANGRLHPLKAEIAAGFLRRRFGNAPDNLHILVWAKKGDHKESHWLSVAQLTDAESFLEPFTKTTAGDVYAGVGLSPENFGRHKRCPKEQVAGIAGLWADIDVKGQAHKKDGLPETMEQARELARSLGMEPTEEIHSGHGLQAWWLFPKPWIFHDDDDRKKAADLIRRVQALLRAQANAKEWEIDSTHDLPRILRLPGTWNHKTADPVRVRVLQADGPRYRPGELFALVRKVATPRPRGAEKKGRAQVLAEGKRIPEGERDATLTSLAGSMRRSGMTEEEIFAGLKAVNETRCDPPLPEDQVRKIARSVAGYEPGDGTESGEGKRESQATRLVKYAQEALDLFHTAEGQAFATTRAKPRQTWLLRSKAARQYLARLFFEQEESAPGSEALQTTITTLEGIALFDGYERPVFTRIAGRNGRIFLDLGDAEWRTATIFPGKWKVVDSFRVRFRRSRGSLALPVPLAGGMLEDLRRFVNVADEDWPLLAGWLLAAFRPNGPYPVLCLYGEQGSAKSTTARVLRMLVDPNSAPLRAEPRNPRDLIIAATNSWVVALDNLSHVPPWLSDALCRLATGGGFATRELYTDADEVLFDAQRPVILNGIVDLATRGDLLERSLLLTLPTIPEDRRQTEAEFWAAFEIARPRILGAILDTVAAGLRELPNVKLSCLPRMADFAKWVTACEPALGWEPGTFLEAYRGNRATANETALDSSPITKYLLALITCKDWKGSAGELLVALEKDATPGDRQLKSWPLTPRGLSGVLRRLAPNLRQIGVNVEFDRQGGGNRSRQIRLSKDRPNRPNRPRTLGNP